MSDDDNTSREDLTDLLENLGICVLEEKLRLMVGKVDADGDAQLDAEEFGALGGWILDSLWPKLHPGGCDARDAPMIGGSIHAEQRVNMVFMGEEMWVAPPLDEGENGFVPAAEQEKFYLG
ncbi:Calmodulin-like protein 5 [Striga hermonthica]|uniref:Calmodulin-like protein 5 n=1 Tax=Striga hermonthica TaxID=68872 RepID=A0A9N7MRS3_STRHE|nr:Calmodulin-like protein 5 [Striga hermonthica]